MMPCDIIKNLRLQFGLSQENFAREIHVSFATVNRWENNKSTPNRMAKALLIDYCEKHNIDKEIIDAISKIR